MCIIYAALKRKTEKEYEIHTQKMVRLNWPSSCGSSFMRDPFVRLQLFKICTILIKHHSFFFFVYILIIQWFCRDVAGCAGATFHRILVTLFFVIILCTFLSLLFLIHFFYFQIFSVLIRMFHCQLYCSITATEKRRIRYIKNTRSLAHIHAFLFLPLFYADSREKQFCDNCIISDIDRS